MALSIENIEIDRLVSPPQCDLNHRSRSVVYALDGTALEDRLGNFKKSIVLTFGYISANEWEYIKNALKQKQIHISGSVGGADANGTYRLTDDVIPTPIQVVQDNRYYCQPFSVKLEEI